MNRHHIVHKRIPTLLGLLLLVGTLSLTSFLVQGNLNFFSNAAPDTTPQHITVTNITSNSFTVTYMTANPALGSIQYGVHGPNENIVNDERDTGAAQNHTAHSIRISRLTPKATYQFSILSNGNTYDNAGTPYHVMTRPSTQGLASYKAITGTIGTPGQEPLGEALVLITGDSISPMSTIARSDGSFSIPLANSPLTLTDSTKLTISVFTAGSSGRVTTLFGQTHPVPLITLSQTFDFTSTVPNFANETASSTASLATLPGSSATKQTPQQPTIISPYKDQAFKDPQPTFTGDALPSTLVSVTVDQTTSQARSDAMGTWTFRPTAPLSTGNHTISISSKDAFGIMKTLQQSFTILAAGSQIDTSPSVAPVNPTATPTSVPTPTLTSRPTPTIGVLTPTTIPTFVPTATLAPSPTLIPTQVATGPTATPAPLENFKTGSSVSTLAAILGGIMTAVGVLIFLLSRGSSLL